jgi:hypothetical protein
MAEDVYHVGDLVEVNLAGLGPIVVTDVLIDLEAHEDWHPGVIRAVLSHGSYDVRLTPLVGAIEIPPVDATRLRPTEAGRHR